MGLAGLGAPTSRVVEVWPVVQATSIEGSLEQSETAVSGGADGLFLINHDADHPLLADCIRAVAEAWPDLRLGANLIRETPAEALRRLHELLGGAPPLAALWSDDAQLGSALGPERAAASFQVSCDEFGWHGTHFGGVAFKYQTPVPDHDLPALGRLARQWVDIPTTSGPGTGKAITLRRLELLREGLGEHSLALASGVSEENIGLIAPFVSHVLVSTSISTDGKLDGKKLERLLQQMGTVE